MFFVNIVKTFILFILLSNVIVTNFRIRALEKLVLKNV